MVQLSDFGGPQFNPNPRGDQQGTLFSNRRLNAANRTGDEVGHKGYSENRLNAVREALPVKIASGGKVASGRGLDAGSAYVKAHPLYRELVTGKAQLAEGEKVPKDPSIKGRKIARTLMTEDVHRDVASSTMPAEHIAAITPTPIHIKNTTGGQGATGQYELKDRFTGQGEVTLHPRSRWDSVYGRPEATLMHEIGHAVDFRHHAAASTNPSLEIGPVPGVRSGDALSLASMSAPIRSARVEGFADAYADRHGGGSSSDYPNLTDQQWERYSGKRHPPDLGGPTPSEAYSEARRVHGGNDPSARTIPAAPRLSSDQFPLATWYKPDLFDHTKAT